MIEAVEIKKTTKEEISTTIQEYYKRLIAPMDDMWENAIIGVSSHYRIIFQGDDAGYFCLDNDNVLLQYFIKDEFLDKSKELFKCILERCSIEKGFVSTMDTRSLPLFIDFNTEIHTHAFLYKDNCYADRINIVENTEIKLAESTELEKIIDYHENSVDIKGSWLQPYCSDLITKQELFLFIANNEIIGTGERRISKTQKEYAHLGVTVSKKYRRNGLASYILFYLKKDCYKNGLIPVCSTGIKNIGSQKAIENAGFFAYHRIFQVKFEIGIY